jgi:lysyl-tRNA synthetase, class II
MTLVAEETSANDLNRRVEPDIPRRKYTPGAGWTRHVPNVLRSLLWAVAVFSAVTAVFPALARALSGVRDVIATVFVPAPPNIAWAALLVIFASALGKRKRSAWWFLVVILVLGMLESVVLLTESDVRTKEIVTLATSLVFFVILLLARKEFFAIVPRRNVVIAVVTLLVGFAVVIPIGWAMVEALPGSVPRSDAGAYAVNQLLGGLGEADATGIEGRATRPVPFLLGALGTVVYVAFGLALFRTRGNLRRITGQDEVDLRVLLHDHGDRDSLGYFATRRDKSAMWSPSHKSAVTYRVVNGVSLASADPIGDPESWPPAIEEWLEEARHYGWAPAVMGASEAGAEAYVRAGLEALSLGDEAIIEFSQYTLDGRHMRAVRQAVHRLERDGYTTRVRRHRDIPADQMAEVVVDADRWRDTHNERGFSMALGRLGDPLDGQCVLTEIFDAGGVRRGLLSFSPWGTSGISLDLMRRDPDAENGVMELMVTATVNAGPLIGADRLSLNFAVMRAIFEEGAKIGAGPVMRASRAFLMFASRWWQLESLYKSNEKYEPDWVPRYLLFERSGDLPRVGIAAGLAEGFVEKPRLPFTGGPRESLADGAAASPVVLWAPVAEELSARDAEETAAISQRRLPEQELVRREKLTAMRERGVDPYATDFDRQDMIGDLRSRFGDLPADTRTGAQVHIAGRVMLNRVTGKLVFAQVKDWSGQMQVMLSLGEVGDEILERWKREVDLGDHVGVAGEVITSKRGELSVFAKDFVITSKCLVPLPDKHAGLTDPEARTRQRYVDLIVNDSSREMVALRSTAIRALRESLWRRGFLEVDTPMLQTIHGGANARPFITHINAYDMRLYLRIAPELFLKRLLVGGVEKIFEVNRNFRNEGADATHNPEFSSLEIYDAYGSYETMRVLTREIILEIATAVYGRPIARRPLPDGGYEEIDLSPEWPTMTVHEGVSHKLGEQVTVDTPEQVLRGYGARLEIPMDPAWDAAACLLELYEHLCEDTTTFPTFYLDFPTEVSPLTRKMPSEPRLAEKWDLVGWGAELGTAYTELIDPLDQRDRLVAQSLLAASGDVEAMEVDEDFLRALEYGMPPAGGQGMGVERVIMMLTGQNIRDTMLFPLVKPE